MTKTEQQEIKKKIEDNTIYNEPRYKRWRARLFKRDGYGCQYPECKWPMGTIAGHHIRMKWYNPELIYTLTNGITLCEYHHKYIHKRGSDNYIEVFEAIALINMEKPIVRKKVARKVRTMSKKLVKKILKKNKKKGKKRVIRFNRYRGPLTRTL